MVNLARGNERARLPEPGSPVTHEFVKRLSMGARGPNIVQAGAGTTAVLFSNIESASTREWHQRR